MRGWSRNLLVPQPWLLVLPADAGVVRRGPRPACRCRRFSPRTRGWSRYRSDDRHEHRQFSPRMRGWSVLGSLTERRVVVFSAEAGVVPPSGHRSVPGHCCSRRCGGGPVAAALTSWSMECSPHRRGWFRGTVLLVGEHLVVPAYAGVVRQSGGQGRRSDGSPRICGGGPPVRDSWGHRVLFPLRMQGWSVLGDAGEGSTVRSPRTGGGVPSLR